ncbi:IclR family transcriptional regulator [Kurthia sibirica]|nr:helix-turn-helix domain-containing protein [Kurthia sibirica]GEK35490.1 IclR family transcriptional regulator [Kurthia sibirica]
MQAMNRMMIITKAISQNHQQGLTISELTERTNLPLATLHRILSSLVEHRFVELDPHNKRYRLGDVWMQYGLQVYDQYDYVSRIRPIMDELAQTVNESIYMHKPMETESMIVERLDGPNSRIHIVDPLGLRTAMPIGAVNQVILSCREFLSKKENPFAIDLAILQNTVLNGYAIASDSAKETIALAAPIFAKNGELLHIISMSVLEYSFTEERKSFLLDQLVATTKKIEDVLYFM